MKKIILLALMLLSANCFAKLPEVSMASSPESLENYEQVLLAVFSGQDIRIALSMKDCTSNGKKVLNPMFQFGFYTPNEVVITNSDTIAASLNHFTTNDSHAPGKPVYQFVTYNLTPDSKMNVSVQVFSATNHMPLSNKEAFVCQLGSGAFVASK